MCEGFLLEPAGNSLALCGKELRLVQAFSLNLRFFSLEEEWKKCSESKFHVHPLPSANSV